VLDAGEIWFGCRVSSREIHKIPDVSVLNIAVNNFLWRPIALGAAMLLSVGIVVVVDGENVAEAAPAKVTLCHRTRALTNPYRRITVSFNAANGNGGNDHQSHAESPTTGPFDPSVHDSSNKTWGDIIPGNDVHGIQQVSAANWTERGQAIFYGTGDTAGLCGKMTAAEFYDIATTSGGLTPLRLLPSLMSSKTTRTKSC